MSDKAHCAWCGPDKSHLPISHGICPDCAEKMERELRAITRDVYAVTVNKARGPLTAGEPACQRNL